MNLLEFSETAKTFDIKDSVSKVTSKMFETKTYNVIITEGKEYRGLVQARDIARKNVNNPDRIEIKQFLRNINPISAETPTKEVIKYFVINDFNAIPIMHDKPRILTKLGLLRLLKDDAIIKKKRAGDIMKYPYCVSVDDSITTVVSIMKEMDVLRMPVLSNGRIEGIVTSIDLLRSDMKSQRSTLGEKYGEKTKMREHSVGSIMDKYFLKAAPSDPLKTIVERMIENKKETTLVEENDRIVGIITPKEIFKQITTEINEQEISDRKRGVYVRISGVQEEDIYIKNLIDSEIKKEVQKLGKIVKINYLVLHVTTSKTSGRRKNYSVKGKLITEHGYNFANNSDWDLTKAVRGVMNRFEREIIKQKDRKR